jgi:hypothetical protein
MTLKLFIECVCGSVGVVENEETFFIMCLFYGV